jgi:hypothetical protein
LSLRISRGKKKIKQAAVLRFNKHCIDHWDLTTPVTLAISERSRVVYILLMVTLPWTHLVPLA